MANVYIEARPKGRPQGDPISDYVVEDHADKVLGTFKTQHEAIAWAKPTSTTHSSRVSAILTTKRHRIIGARPIENPPKQSARRATQRRR
jgi:hypothetical protein